MNLKLIIIGKKRTDPKDSCQTEYKGQIPLLFIHNCGSVRFENGDIVTIVLSKGAIKLLKEYFKEQRGQDDGK